MGCVYLRRPKDMSLAGAAAAAAAAEAAFSPTILAGGMASGCSSLSRLTQPVACLSAALLMYDRMGFGTVPFILMSQA